MRLITDLFAFCAERGAEVEHDLASRATTSARPGRPRSQELAFTLANGIAYVEAVLGRGARRRRLRPAALVLLQRPQRLPRGDRQVPRGAPDVGRAHARALRRNEPTRCWLRFHTQTAGSTLTAQQPDNNVVRVALQALAAVLGGTQSLHTNARDEALGLPTEEAARLALRTQQVIAEESGIADGADPLGGAYVESLTDEIESQARGYLERIDEMGGALAAIEAGFQEREIAEAAYRHQRAVEEGGAVVGVNASARGGEPDPDSPQSTRTPRGGRSRACARCAPGATAAGRGGAGRPPRRRRRRRQPDAADPRRRPRRGHGGRDLRHPARRLRRAPAATPSSF